MTITHLISNKIENKIFNNLDDISLYNSLNELTGGDLLISYSNGKIIPKEILDSYRVKINFHCGPIEFPGRDPHHWAAYFCSKFYGGVCHFMNSTPDSGKIIKYNRIAISKNLKPNEIDKIGEDSIAKLLLSSVAEINDINFQPISKKWNEINRTRKNLIDMCDFRNLSSKEIKHREYAFNGFENYFKY